jgi:hypothetical protein
MAGTYAEELARRYKGHDVQIYFNESSGTSHYADDDKEQKLYMTGKIQAAFGDLLVVHATSKGADGVVVREVSLFGWSITGVMPVHGDGDRVHISRFFKPTRR